MWRVPDARAARPRPPAPAPPGTAAAPGAPGPPAPRRSSAADGAQRPDAERGVFESIRVVDGVAVAAERHLDRLARSARELYAVELPPALPALVAHAAVEQGGPCRLRVLLDPDGSVHLDAAPAPAAAAAIAVDPVALPGGLGAHKWRDRRLVEALDREAAPAVPLLVDADGAALETTRASVLAVVGDTLVAPPLDGRILPGVTRARVLAHAEALGVATAERPLTLDDLLDADVAFAVNALRGLEVVRAAGDVAVAAEHPLARRLAAALAADRR